MRKKVNLIIAGLVFAGFALFLAGDGAEAFCVYNKTDVVFTAYQTSGQTSGWNSFTKDISPGGKECCNWKEKGCNKGGSRTSNVKIRVVWPPHEGFQYDICEKEFDAGGWLEVTGSGGAIYNNYSCSAHNVK